MTATLFIAGDWGTTHLRLYLCDGERVIDTREAPGIKASRSGHQALLLATINDWTNRYESLPVVLAGMAGARNAWKEIAYVDCPADLNALRARLEWFAAGEHRVAIVPGLACVNSMNAPDVMRGEETQIVGALTLTPELRTGSHLIALPGTHCKWVQLREGRIERFQTTFTGELFSVLQEHSILLDKAAALKHSMDEGAFVQGVRRIVEHRGAALTHLLFEARSRQLREHLRAQSAASFLSGLIVGDDVSGALANSSLTAERVHVVASPVLARAYELALREFHIAAGFVDGAAAVIAGLRSIAQLSEADQ